MDNPAIHGPDAKQRAIERVDALRHVELLAFWVGGCLDVYRVRRQFLMGFQASHGLDPLHQLDLELVAIIGPDMEKPVDVMAAFRGFKNPRIGRGAISRQT